MGDMADYCFDLALQQEAEHEQEVRYWLQKSDNELKSLTARSRKPIILSIRKFDKLSKKQRRVLANYLAWMD